jgi:hypothetical protein
LLLLVAAYLFLLTKPSLQRKTIGEEIMKFLGKWKIEQDKWLPILNKWISMTPQERANAGDGVKIVGRWHDTAARTGVIVMESNDPAAVARYVGQWNPYMDIELSPVLDDEETAAVGQRIVADNKA